MTLFSRIFALIQFIGICAIVTVEFLIRKIFSIIGTILPVGFIFRKVFRRNQTTSTQTSDVDEVFLSGGTVEILKAKGYPVEEHYTQTKDGYILTLHRIPGSRSHLDEPTASSSSHKTKKKKQPKKKVVFFCHGFMQSDEVWVVNDHDSPEGSESLALKLVDSGLYDVWLGNVRGSKYSHKHLTLKPVENEFWDFSLDEIISFDLPAMIEYVLEQTLQEKLSFIAFSQGTAVGFGMLASNPEIASKVNIFIALASTALVKGLTNRFIQTVALSRPNILYYMWGHRSFLSSAIFWRRLVGPHMFVTLCEKGVKLLFGWQSNNMASHEKPVLYSHLYSKSSVKMLIHWFQIIRTGRFAMFDDMMGTPSSDSHYQGHVLPVYPLERIKCQVAMFYGGRDGLPDIEKMLELLPKNRIAVKIDEYEHLDFQWAASNKTRIHPKIISLLEKYSR